MDSTQLNDFFDKVKERDKELKERYYASNKENFRSLYGVVADADN